MCNHEGTQFYCHRTFKNGTKHLCSQCGECGVIVKHGDKTWLKPEDVPDGEEILEFDEKLYSGGSRGLFG